MFIKDLYQNCWVEIRLDLPPGLKFLGCGVTAVAAPEDLRDLKR